MTTKAEPSTRPICGSGKKHGDGICRQRAGWGTDHDGVGYCKLHGGNTPNGKKYAANLQAASLATTLEMEPHDALLDQLYRALGLAAYWRAVVASLEPDSVIVSQERERVVSGGDHRGETVVERSSHAELHIALRAEREAISDAARYAKMAVDAGVAERHVRVAEAWGERLARLLDGVLSELELTAAQREKAPAVVRRHLTMLEGGQAAAA